MSTEITTVDGFVYSLEKGFNDVNAYKLNFKKEATFALQLLKANSFLKDTASSNPDSLQNAITNIAAIGISLNPATKEAYLVPRKNQVCLDISAIGLLKLATDSGSILWGQAKLVYEKDSYANQGVSIAPAHVYKSFGDRGKIIGVYVVVKTTGGDFLTEEMSLDECHKIRDRSEAWKSFKAGKAKSCPWESDEGEMVRKTVIKRASKLWPKSERLDTAVQVLNEHEGIDFKNEKAPYVPCGTEAPTDKTFENIRALLKAKNKTEDGLLNYISTQSGGEVIAKLEDLNSAQIESAYRILGGGK